MTALTIFPDFRFRLFTRAERSVTVQDDHDRNDEQRADRAFLNDVLDHCPEAFRSEEDVQTMMCLFPGRF